VQAFVAHLRYQLPHCELLFGRLPRRGTRRHVHYGLRGSRGCGGRHRNRRPRQAAGAGGGAAAGDVAVGAPVS
jgi:hypothetical protein